MQTGKKPLTEIAPRQTFLGRLSSSVRWAWLSRLRKKASDDERGYVEAEGKLVKAYKDLWMNADDLRDIGTAIERDRAKRKAETLEAKERLANAERRYKERYNNDTIAQKQKDHEIRRLDIEAERIEAEKQEVELRRLENEKRLRALRGEMEGTGEPAKKKRAVDPIYSKVKEGIKQAKTAERSEKGIEESGLSEEQKKKLRKELRIAMETQREEK